MDIKTVKTGDYRHNKTGKIYTVMYIAFDKNNDTQLQVVYQDADHNVYIREINDFSEKFTKVNQDEQ